MGRNKESGVVQKMAGELLEAVTRGDKVSKELIETAENIIQTHQLYVQLLYVGMVVERITQLQYDFQALDAVIEDIDTEDIAEADAGTKLRAVTAYNQSIKNKIDVINTMMSSRDAIGLLISSLKETFGGEPEVFEDAGAGQELMGKLAGMTPAKRQELLGGIVTMLAKSMPEEEPNDEE
jgi:hypothetical protein